MEKKINNILFLTTKDGERLTFKVLFTHHSETFNKDYAVFYNEADENHLIVYSFDENMQLHEVENDDEFAELEVVLHAYDEEQAAKALDAEEGN